MPETAAYTLEVCVDDPSGVAACQGLVDRIELCSSLALGGLTPSAGLIANVREGDVPIHAMIRPRAGGFTYLADERAVMLADIATCRAAGIAGVVFGATTQDRQLDIDTLKTLREAAGDLDCTLHRAIDIVTDPVGAVEVAITLGFQRILTSGGAPCATDGLQHLSEMQTAAQGRIDLMVGSGVTAQNAAQIARATGVTSFHASCRSTGTAHPDLLAFGFENGEPAYTDRKKIMALRGAIHALQSE